MCTKIELMNSKQTHVITFFSQYQLTEMRSWGNQSLKEIPLRDYTSIDCWSPMYAMFQGKHLSFVVHLVRKHEGLILSGKKMVKYSWTLIGHNLIQKAYIHKYMYLNLSAHSCTCDTHIYTCTLTHIHRELFILNLMEGRIKK